MKSESNPILVIGGGIAGMTAALEAAEVGSEVILIERNPYLGGRVVQMYRYFPKMCPPTCGFEINVRRIRQNPRIKVYTLSTLEKLTGKAGAFRATLRIRPRYVTGRQSIDDELVKRVSSERPDDFNYGMSTTRALYRPHDAAWPSHHVLDKIALSEEDRSMLESDAPEGAIDFEMPEREVELDVGSVIFATGWKPYDAAKLDNLGGGELPDVITNVQMERLASKGGPTGGEIVRPSDGKRPAQVAFVQCAGSRDENHLAYCSAVCCMASLKQVRYLREDNPDSRVTVFYIDIRTLGRLEKFYYDLLEDDHVSFVKGKVAGIESDVASAHLKLEVEDTVDGNKLHPSFDMVVLATGMVPNGPDAGLSIYPVCDDYGFFDGSTSTPGIYAVGCAKHPCDVSRATKDGTAAALRAIQTLHGEVSHG